MIILAWLLTLFGGILFSVMVIKKWAYFGRGISYIMFLLGILALSPINNLLPTQFVAPTQIVYRFDDHRYIQLTGYRCEGQAYFIDEKEKIYYELAPHFWQVFTEPYSHPSQNYISIPLGDVSAMFISDDGGRSFYSAHFYPSEIYLNNKVQQIIVTNEQTFVLTKKGVLYTTHKPFGSHSGDIMTKEKIVKSSHSGRFAARHWQDISVTIPAVPSDYTGWDKMRCDYSAPSVPLPKARTLLQVYQTWLGVERKELQ